MAEKHSLYLHVLSLGTNWGQGGNFTTPQPTVASALHKEPRYQFTYFTGECVGPEHYSHTCYSCKYIPGQFSTMHDTQ